MQVAKFQSLQVRTVLLITLALVLVHGLLLAVDYRRLVEAHQTEQGEKLSQLGQVFQLLLERSGIQLQRLTAQIATGVHLPSAIAKKLAATGPARVTPPQLFTGIESVRAVSPLGELLAHWETPGSSLAPPTALLAQIAQQAFSAKRPISLVTCYGECAQHAFVPVITDSGEAVVVVTSRPIADALLDFHQVTGAEIGILGEAAPAGESGPPALWGRRLSAFTGSAALLPKLRRLPDPQTLSEENPEITSGRRHYVIDLLRLPLSIAPRGSLAVLLASDDTAAVRAIGVATRRRVTLALSGLALTILMLILVLRPPMARLRRLAATLPLLARQEFSRARSRVERSFKRRRSADEIALLSQATLDLADRLETLNGEVAERTLSLDQKILELERQRDFTDQLLDNAQLVILLHSLDGRVLKLNRYGEELIGLSTAEIEAEPVWRLLYSGDDPASLFDKDFAPLAQALRARIEIEGHLTCSNQTARRMFWRHSRLESMEGLGPVLLSVGLDVTDRREAEDRLRWLRTHDAVTHLVNRPAFISELDRGLAPGPGDAVTLSLLLFDVDHFRDVNSRVGYAGGDAILLQIAKLALQSIPEAAIIGRGEGARFLALLPNLGGQAAMTIAVRANETLQRHTYDTGESAVHISVSVGVASFPEHGSSHGELFANLEIALAQAKQAGGGRVRLYQADTQLGKGLQERALWRERIAKALQEDRFVLHFQPILDVRSGEIHHCEALLRLVDERGVDHAAGRILGMSAQTGQIRAIEHTVLRKAIHRLGASVKAGAKLSIGINLDAQSFEDPDLMRLIGGLLAEYRAPAASIIFEIVETAAIANLKAAAQRMGVLSKMGVRFAFDDFGVGFTSFEYLRVLPVQYVKIDRSFITHIRDRSQDEALVRSMVALVHSLGKETVAEGVEDRETLELLREIGVDYCQGYYVGRPHAALPTAGIWRAPTVAPEPVATALGSRNSP